MMLLGSLILQLGLGGEADVLKLAQTSSLGLEGSFVLASDGLPGIPVHLEVTDNVLDAGKAVHCGERGRVRGESRVCPDGGW